MILHKLKLSILLLCFFFTCSLTTLAQSHSPRNVDSILTAHNFPLFSLVQQDPSLIASIKKDKIFIKIAKNQQKRIKKSLLSVSQIADQAAAFRWTEKETLKAGDALVKLYQGDKELKMLVLKLRKQGAYALADSSVDTAFLRFAWNTSAKGINHILDVYLEGIPPRYAKIDSISFPKNSISFKKQVQDSLKPFLSKSNKVLFFERPLKAALIALKINGRDESARYSSLNEGLNKEPFSKIKETNFSAYVYSMILIPGLGPELPGVALDPNGAKRCEEGVLRYKKGLAPFIVVSGGHVHPFKTPFNEAVEMKKYIVEKLGIPANVVFIEPDARHTTTNLRNTSRMIYKFGIPADKPLLIVTDKSQSSYIVSAMTKTAIRDLGFVPYQGLKMISETETEFYPIWNSLQVDPLDPLDP